MKRSFSLCGEPEMVREMLGEMQELCQVLFESIQTRIARINAKEERKFSSPITRFCQRGAARHEWRKQRSLALIGFHRSDFLSHWTFGRIEKRQSTAALQGALGARTFAFIRVDSWLEFVWAGRRSRD